MTTYFLLCSDLATALVGPFNSVEEIEAHRKFLDERGDADPVGIVFTAEELSNHSYDYTITPQEDRAE